MGNKDSRLRRIYHNMKTRCTNENYDKWDRYGGRGITVCEEWISSFKNFEQWAIENGYTDELTLDRIDNDGNYTPTNCRWITREEQANNRTTSMLLDIYGVQKTCAEWAKEAGIPYATLRNRIKNGWNPNDAVTAPIDSRFNTKRLYLFEGEMLPIKQISKRANVNDTLLRRYLNYGYDINEALAKLHYGEQ